MALRFNINAKAGQWVNVTDSSKRIMETGLTKAMREVGKRAADAANNRIHAAGFASRKWELRPKNYPASGISLTPEVWLHSRINFEDVFESGRVIHGSPWLWLPLPSVPLWPGDSTRQMSPKKYVETVGDLVTIRRKGKPPMLGAAVSGSLKPQPFGRFVSRARLKRGRFGRGPVTVVPMFVGVSSVVIEKKFDVFPAVQSVTDQMQGLYAENESPT